MSEIKVGDVVQIDPTHDPVFGACFLVVTELKSFGVMGYVMVPVHPAAGEAYYRVAFDKIHRIGCGEWLNADLGAEVALTRDEAKRA